MTEGLATHILPWLAPPLFGAAAGALAAFIGVRVLLASHNLLRNRSSLARILAEWVSRDIDTEKTVPALMEAPAVKEGLSRAVALLTDGILDTHVSAIAASVQIPGPLEEALEGMLKRVIATAGFGQAVREALTQVVTTMSGIRVREALDRGTLRSFLAEKLLPILGAEAPRRSIARGLGDALADRAGELLSDDLLARLAKAAEPLLPVAAERFAQWLSTAETRAEMAARGRELLPRILDKLNVMQRILLSAGQYDRRLAEKMPEIVDDTVRSLQEIARDPAQQRRLLQLGVDSLRDWRRRLQTEAAGPRRGDARVGGQLAGSVAAAAEELLRGLEVPATRERLVTALEGWLAEGDATVGGLANRALGVREADVVEFLSARVLTFLMKEQTAGEIARLLAGIISRFFADNGEAPLRTVLHVDDTRKKKIDDLLLARLSAIIRGVDIGALVSRGIEAIDARTAGRFIAAVVAPFLKWIVAGGAILGLLVGLFQLLVRLLRLG